MQPAQEPAQEPVREPSPNPSADVYRRSALAEPERWEFDSNIFYSDPPGSDGRTTVVVYADRGPLHLEGRYGYEDEDTGAIFGGWTFAGGDEVTASVTPMIGAVFGHTDGIAPAVEFDVGWKRISWYAEAEYLFDSHDSDDDFFYSWSTLMYALNKKFSVGLVTERSKQVETDFELQHGLALQFAGGPVSLAVYAYNLGTDDSYAVVSFGIGL
jgi:hypothetical protein